MELYNALPNNKYIIKDVRESRSKSRLIAYGIYPNNLIVKIKSNKSMAIYNINNSYFAIRHEVAKTIIVSDYNG